MRSTPGHLYSHNLSHQLLLVKIIASVLSIACIIKFDEGKLVFDRNVSYFAILSEEVLNVTFSASMSDTSKINTTCHLSLSYLMC